MSGLDSDGADRAANSGPRGGAGRRSRGGRPRAARREAALGPVRDGGAARAAGRVPLLGGRDSDHGRGPPRGRGLDGAIVATSMLVARAQQYAERTAIGAADGSFSYRDLLDASARVAGCLLEGRGDLGETRGAVLASPGFGYVATPWGVWRAGGVGVPLANSHPPPELHYLIPGSQATVAV